MEQDNGAEAPDPQSSDGQYTEKEWRKIQMIEEALRRSKMPQYIPLTEPKSKADWIDEEESTEVLYPSTRRHILWFFNELLTGKTTKVILILIVFVWLSAYGGTYLLFTPEFVNSHIATETSLAIAATLLLLVLLFLLKIRTFVIWRTWKLEVTSTAIKVGHPGVGWLGIDDTQDVFKRSGGEVAKVVRKWYFVLFVLNSYIVSFDSASQMDDDFKDLKFIKNGKKLKDIFD
jgi:hypothetical protein